MAGFIAPAVLEQVRAANDIVEIISAVVPLKRAGVNWVALCPFHREKTPSFHVNPRKQTFHCFGCHKGGDVFTFLRDYESLDFVEAVKRLAERAQIPLQFDKDPQYQEKQFLKDKLLDIHEQMTQRWHQALLNDAGGERARKYLADRGVAPDAIKTFRLGYSPDAWDDTVNWARSKGYDPAMVEQCGLIVRKEGSSNYYGRFRGRLMFPICDEQGRVIGFSGRVLPGDDDPRKYVNSPETPLFTKSRVMFGLDKSRRALVDKQFAIVCEGQLDLIACYMAGIQNVVAPQGTALTADHTRILKRYVNEVVLCFDSDEAGQKAAVRALDDVLGSGLAVRVATIPAPHDPDSFIKEFGASAFEERIQNAPGFFDFYLDRLCRVHNPLTDKGQKQIIAAMAEGVQKSGDPTLVDKYAQKTAARVGIPANSTLTLFRKAQQKFFAETSDDLPTDSEDDSWRPNTQEIWLLKILLLHDELVDWARRNLDLQWLENDLVREILIHRLAGEPGDDTPQPVSFLGALEHPKAQLLVTESLAEERPIPRPETQVVDATIRVRNQFLDRQSAALKQQMADPNLPPGKVRELLEQFAELQSWKQTRLTV